MFQVDASFDPEDAKKVLYWIQAATGQQFPIEESNERYKVMENFYKTLKDGRLLCLWVDGLQVLLSSWVTHSLGWLSDQVQCWLDTLCRSQVTWSNAD